MLTTRAVIPSDCTASAAPSSVDKAGGCVPLPTLSVPPGMTRESNGGGGDCLFLAASQSCANRLSEQVSGYQLRLGTVAHTRLLSDKFDALWDGNCPEVDATPMPGRDFGAYLDHVALRRTWAGGL